MGVCRVGELFRAAVAVVIWRPARQGRPVFPQSLDAREPSDRILDATLQVGPQFMPKKDKEWMPGYHGMLYNLTDDAVQGVQQHLLLASWHVRPCVWVWPQRSHSV